VLVGELSDSANHALTRGSGHTVQAGKMDSCGSCHGSKPISRSAVAVVPERRRHEGGSQPISRDPTAATPGVVEVRRRRVAAASVGAQTGPRRRPQRPGGAPEPVDGCQVVCRGFVVARRKIKARLMMMLMVVVDR